MQPITVLVSACGAPGTAALMRALRQNGERRSAPRRHRYVGACDRPAPRGRIPPGSGGLRPRLRGCDARGLPRRARGRDRPPVLVRPARPRRGEGPLRGDRRARLDTGGNPALERQGRDVRDAGPDRRQGPCVAAGRRRRRRRPGSPRARLPRPRRLHEAGVLVRVARVPRPVRLGRPARAATDEPPRRRGGAPARGPRGAPRRRPDRAPRHGARDRQGADDRRDRGRRAHRARPSEDPRGDARRARDVLRDARRPRR